MHTAGCRRIGALIDGLPLEAAVWREDRDPWTQGDHLTAALLETVDYWGRVQVQRTGVPAYKLPKQIQVPRPGDLQRKRKVETDPRTIAAFFSKHVGGG